jgi:hypothetical protein
MASVLAIISRAVFDALPVCRVGQLAALDRYVSKQAAFTFMASADAIFLVTVRDGDVVWLVAIIERPQYMRRGVYVGAINKTPITDITKLVPRLELVSGDGIHVKRGRLAMSLQTARGLADADVKLLRGAVPRTRAPAPVEAIEMRTQKRVRKRATADPTAPPPNVGGPVPASVRALIDQVYTAPHDRALRAVVADALLEHRHVWGELIALQLDGAAKHRRRIAEIIKKHAPDFVGPIVHLSTRDDLEFVDGFLDGCAATKTLAWGGVGRKQWAQAARAKQWSTVTRVLLDPWVTPNWWIAPWIRNKATANLVAIRIGNVRFERASPGAAWQLAIPRAPWGDGLAVALLTALPAAERTRVATTTPNARAALDRARAKRS